MAYFPNGTSFACWQAEHCDDCLNYRDNGTGSHGCAITDMHFVLDYHDGTNAAVLDSLIPQEAPEAFQCRMRLTAEILEADRLAERAARDKQQYALAMAEMRA